MIPISIYMIAYNEDVVLQYTIDFYKERFPGAKFTIFDNESTDKTKEIALKNGCEVISFSTNNQIVESRITHIKNTCWLNAPTDWVLVCDPDECLDITEEQLKEEEAKGVSIIKSEGWNMVNMEDNYDIAQICHGTRVPQFDKNYLFDKRSIKIMNYQHGCHSASPQGQVKFSDKAYKLYHFKCIHPDYLVLRARWTQARLSDENKRGGLGSYWINTDEGTRNGFMVGRELAKENKVR